MANSFESDCHAQIAKASPEQPWQKDTPVSKFEPLVNLIEQHTQSDMFRHQGKYEQNADYYDMAHKIAAQGKTEGKETFKNGASAEVTQFDGWPVKLVLEDKARGLKETVELGYETHSIKSDTVEFCGTSRERHFGQYGENYRAYTFPGGRVERSGNLPELKLE